MYAHIADMSIEDSALQLCWLGGLRVDNGGQCVEAVKVLQGCIGTKVGSVIGASLMCITVRPGGAACFYAFLQVLFINGGGAWRGRAGFFQGSFAPNRG